MIFSRVVLEVVRQSGSALEHTSEDLRANLDIVWVAVQQNGFALEHTSEELKADQEVVLSAVQQNGLALQFVSDELRGDKEVVLSAVLNNGEALDFILKEFEILKHCRCKIQEGKLVIHNDVIDSPLQLRPEVKDTVSTFLGVKDNARLMQTRNNKPTTITIPLPEGFLTKVGEINLQYKAVLLRDLLLSQDVFLLSMLDKIKKARMSYKLGSQLPTHPPSATGASSSLHSR